MKLNTAICDDDSEVCQTLNSLLNTYEILKDIDIHTSQFSDGKSLISSYNENDTFHILFLDIEMPGMNGIKTAEYIKNNLDRNVFVVFITNYPKYMQDSFSAHPYQYLQKPLMRDQIFDVMDSIIKDINDSHIIKTIVSVGYKEETVNIRDILYIETTDTRKDLISFHLRDDNRVLTCHGRLLNWEKELMNYNFSLCCRGLLVNLLHIHYFEKSDIILDNGERIHMSRGNGKKLRELYMNRVVILKRY